MTASRSLSLVLWVGFALLVAAIMIVLLRACGLVLPGYGVWHHVGMAYCARPTRTADVGDARRLMDEARRLRLQLLQAQVDDSADIFKRSGQFFALRFRGAGTFLAITGHLFAQHPFATFMSALEQVNFGKQIAGGVLFAPEQKQENGD